MNNFNNFKFDDNRPIMEQCYEIQRMYDNLKQHSIKMDELFVVSSIIDKIPHTWKYVRSTLKHKKKEIDLTQLATHLHIEARIHKPKKEKDLTPISTINMVGGNSNKSKFSFKEKSTNSNKSKFYSSSCMRPSYGERPQNKNFIS